MRDRGVAHAAADLQHERRAAAEERPASSTVSLVDIEPPRRPQPRERVGLRRCPSGRGADGTSGSSARRILRRWARRNVTRLPSGALSHVRGIEPGRLDVRLRDQTTPEEEPDCEDPRNLRSTPCRRASDARRARRQGAAARERRLEVRPDPAVHRSGAAARAAGRPRLLGARLPVQPVRRPGAGHGRGDRRVLLDDVRRDLPDVREDRGQRRRPAPDLRRS